MILEWESVLGSNLRSSSRTNAAMVTQALTLGREVAEVYAQAITLLRRLESTPVDATTLVGLDAAGLYQLSKVRCLQPSHASQLSSGAGMTVPRCNSHALAWSAVT